MKFNFFVGVDLAKLSFDVSIYSLVDRSYFYQKFPNTKSGFNQFFKWLQQTDSPGVKQTLICMEHTGVYALPLCIFLQDKKLPYCLQPALQIKRSAGIKRGKNDQIDAQMIARYAYVHREELIPSKLPSKTILRLKSLLSYRERLVKCKVSLQTAHKELNAFGGASIDKFVKLNSLKQIQHLTKSINELDKKIKQVIEQDQQVSQAFSLATSVKGVGLQIAAHMIVSTHCFTRFENWRKYSCYCSLAPFEYSSGISIRGKTKVSHLGNKKLKALIGNGIASAVQHDPELSSYYHRKIQEGKHKLSVQNAIKNKLISRVFATVKRGTPYVTLDQHLS